MSVSNETCMVGLVRTPISASYTFSVPLLLRTYCRSPPALFRPKVINIPGYTLEEKVKIAEVYLIPKQMKKNGVSAEHMLLPRSTVLRVASSYTREAGVRQLERELAAVCRHVALKVGGATVQTVNMSGGLVGRYRRQVLVVYAPADVPPPCRDYDVRERMWGQGPGFLKQGRALRRRHGTHGAARRDPVGG